MRSRISVLESDDPSLLLDLYLPTRAVPPYQTLLYVPGSGVFHFYTVAQSTEWVLLPQWRSGRAVLAVVMHGMIERAPSPGSTPPAPPSVGFRDLMVKNANELRMAVDYLVTRREIDRTKLAHVGFSRGAGSRKRSPRWRSARRR